MVNMASINCPYAACNKVFEKPVIVTNFSFMPQKETYYACPYCLTKLGPVINNCESPFSTNENLNQTSATPQTIPEHPTTEKRAEYSMVPQKIAFENIKNLEKEKADLLAELEELRKGAEAKISRLEKEVAGLKEESEILKHLTEN